MVSDHQPISIPRRPPAKPNQLGVWLDFLNRAVRGELHLPPWWLRDVGGTDFKRTGQEFLQYFIQLGGLQPDEDVLEIGCGSGRMALALTGYLNQSGSYVGMDITGESIRWCQKHLTRRYPNFRFFHIDLYNRRYNPGGTYQAAEYTFPFSAYSFDFIFLTSVFTHLLPAETSHYLAEIARLLKPNGRGLVTFFLLNSTQQRLAEQGWNKINFRYGAGSYRLRDEHVPESAVAYEETFLKQLLEQSALTLSTDIQYGTWSGRVDGLSYQDIVLIRTKRFSDGSL